MAHIITKRRWREQPSYPVETDFGHSIARGLFDEGIGGAYYSAKGKPIIQYGNMSRAAGPGGLAYRGAYQSSNNYFRINEPSFTSVTSAVSFEAIFSVTAFQTTVYPYISGIIGGYHLHGYGAVLRLNNNATLDAADKLTFFVVNSSTAEIHATSSYALSTNRVYHAFGTYNGAAVRLYIDGGLVASTALTGAIKNELGYLAIGSDYVGTFSEHARCLHGDIYLFRYWNRGLDADEIGALTDAPYLLSRPRRQVRYFVGGGGGATLSIASLSHGHALDALDLSQAHSLSLADLAHGHAMEAPTIQVQGALEVSDLSHGHSLDAVVLGQAHVLSLSDLAHGHSLEPVTLTQAHVLLLSDLAHGHALDAVTLTQAHSLALADLAHGHAVEPVTLSQAHVLALADLAHGHSLESAALTQAHTLAMSDLAHGHALEPVTLSQAHVLLLSDLAHGHALESPTLGAQGSLSVADLAHAHAVDAAPLSQAHVLTVADASHGHAVDALALVYGQALAPADLAHGHAVDAVTLTQAHLLAVSDLLHAHAADALALGYDASLVISDALHAHLLDACNLYEGVREVYLDPARLARVAPENRFVLIQRERRIVIVAPSSFTRTQ